MKIGAVNAEPLTQKRQLLTCLIWGKPACGKTVLASTAPGKKLWLLFDPGGTSSLDRRDDIIVADLSAYKPSNYQDFKSGGSVERDVIAAVKSEGINTIVVDSLTSYGQNALYYGIVSGKASKGKFTASIEDPGMTGYGVRTAMVLDFTAMIMRLCADLGVHCILITHETEEYNDTEKPDRVTGITFALSGGAKNVLPAKISEIWMMQDTGRERLIYVRNHALWSPMRTRMFDPKTETRFTWKYSQLNAKTHDGTCISDWYSRWEAGNFTKQPLPAG